MQKEREVGGGNEPKVFCMTWRTGGIESFHGSAEKIARGTCGIDSDTDPWRGIPWSGSTRAWRG